MIKHKIIYGCESRGDGDKAYLSRWVLLETKAGSLYLHKFYRSDADDQHDHPWPFWSVVLWPGYYDVTPLGSMRRWPLVPAFRPATWRHRVVLMSKACPRCCHPKGCECWSEWLDKRNCPVCHQTEQVERSCYTLIWVGPKVRDWGFFTKNGWQVWRDYFHEKGC